jgi:hypothetical protein
MFQNDSTYLNKAQDNQDNHCPQVSSERMVFFNEGALRRALLSYAEHYHHERSHQGVGNRLLEPEPEVGRRSGPMECLQRLDGMLRYYHQGTAS